MTELEVEEAAGPQELAGWRVSDRGRMLTDVCNAVGRLHKELYGKGPTTARAFLAHDVLTVLLEGGYTRGEETLREAGHVADVLGSRLTLNRLAEQDFRDAIEQIVRRRVRSFMSASDPGADLQAEVFVLEPQEAAQQGSGRDDAAAAAGRDDPSGV